MTILGQSKEAIKKPQRNILPPFEDEGWERNKNAISEESKYGYELGFTGIIYSGFTNYNLPVDIAGKTVSLSVESLEGDGKPWVILRYNVNGSRQQHVITEVGEKSPAKIEGIDIPYDAKGIHVIIEASQSGERYCYVKNVQLELGGATKFKERIDVSEESERGLTFNGVDGYVHHISALEEVSYLKSYSIESVFKVNDLSSHTIFQNSHSSADRNGMAVVSNILTFGYYDAVSWKSVSTRIPTGEYIHVVAVCHDQNLSLYVNGVKHTSSLANVYVHAAGGLYIGKTSTPDRPIFRGSMRSFKAYGLPLSDKEALKAFEGESLPYSKLVDYDFTSYEVDSDIVKDLSGNQRDANIYGGSKYIQEKPKKIPYKNLLNKKDITLGVYTSGSNNNVGTKYSLINEPHRAFFMMPIDPKKVYTISADTMSFYVRGLQDENLVSDGVASGFVNSARSYTYFPTPSSKYLSLNLRRFDEGTVTQKDIDELNIQIEEGSVETEYEEYREVSKPVKLSNRKQSFKKYPFEFKRQSVNEFDDRIVGLNQPRIDAEKGLYIEDRSFRNVILESADGEGVSPWGRDTSTVTLSNSNDISPLYGKNVTKWTKSDGSGTGNCYINGDKIDRSVKSKDWTFSVYVRRADNKPVDTVGIVYMYITNSSGVRVNVNKPSSYIEDCGNGWYKVVRQDSVSEEGYVGLAGMSSLDGSTDWYFDGWKLEPNNIPTSYSKEQRAKERESASIPDISRYLDSERGSIELKFTPISGHNVLSNNYGFQDLSCFSSGGFIIRRNRGSIGEIEFVINPTRYEKININWLSGSPMKYRVEWDNSKNITKLIVNDIHELIHLNPFKIPVGELSIGHRAEFPSHNSGNAIYESLIIRNRWGETVFNM